MSKSFYNIEEGCGGIFTFPITNNIIQAKTHAIGTLQLDVSVGVYIPLSDNKCFAAHIFASIADADADQNIGTERNRVPVREAGDMLTDKIFQLLERDVRAHLPPAGELSHRADKALVVCNRLKIGKHDATGPYIIGGLWHFFDVNFQITTGSGFAVNQETGEMDVVTNEEEFSWEACNSAQDEQRKSWNLIFRDGVWWEREVMEGEYGSESG